MYRKTPTIRKAGVAALVALTAVSGLVFASPASAAPATAGDLTLAAASQPTIGVGKANQVAGDEALTVTAGATLTAGDQIVVTVDDSNGSTCAAGDTLTFSSIPTVTQTGTATIVTTLENSGNPLCGTDQLRLNVTGSGTASIMITNIRYTVGTGSAVGDVDVQATLNGAGINDGDASNAFVTTAVLTANDPPVGAESGSGFFTISPLVITEQVPAAADGGLCIYFNENSIDTAAPAPTVATSGGTDTATLTTNAGSIFVVVNQSAPASTTTFTISGVRVSRGSNSGVQTATVFADSNDNCGDGNGAALSADTNVGAVVSVGRTAGSDRFATAQKLFEDNFGCNDWAIIARADQYPDALAASYLAGHANTGILLTNTNSVPQATLNALRNEGVRNVYLMGGTQAISSAVATQLDGTTAYDCGGNPVAPATTLTVERIGGIDRFETARLVAEYPGLTQAGFADINGATAPDARRTAIVASGVNFPDALAAGALAFNGDNNNWCCGESLPLLLSNTASVPADTMAALTNLGIRNVIVVGGTAAVSDAAVAQLTSAGYDVRRIAGINRQATAAELAKAMINEFNYDNGGFVLARGDDFADALTGGPVAGDWNEVILLTGSPGSLSAETTNFLKAWEANFGTDFYYFDVFGGTAAVSAAVVQEALNAASQQ